MRIKRQRLELDNKEQEANKKLLDMERYLANAAVRTCIQPHLLRTRPASPPLSFIPRIFAAQGPPDDQEETGNKHKHPLYPYCLKCHDDYPDHVKEDCPLWVVCRWCYSPLHAHDECPVPHYNCTGMSCVVPKTHPNYGLILSRAVLAPPGLSYKPITPRPRDRGNISHDPTRDSSRDPFATHTSRDLSARDPGNLRPRDPGKITHDLSRNWSSTMSHDKTRFGRASNPLINTWQIVGTINKTCPLNNQRTRNATRSTKTRLFRARP